MTREELLENKVLINWWATNQETDILYKRKIDLKKENVSWMRTNCPTFDINFAYIQNDELVKLRKLIAENKDNVVYRKGNWMEDDSPRYIDCDINPQELISKLDIQIKSDKFKKRSDGYCIKPTFEMGNWVYVPVTTDNNIQEILVQITNMHNHENIKFYKIKKYNNIKCSSYTNSWSSDDEINNKIQKWLPKHGEKVLVGNCEDNFDIIGVFDEECSSKYKIKGNLATFDYIEPIDALYRIQEEEYEKYEK